MQARVPYKLIYISGSQLPSRFANAYQKTKTCEALAERGVDITLVSQTDSEGSQESIYKEYGIKKEFPIVLFKGARNHVSYSLTVLRWISQNRGSGRTVLYVRETPLVYVVLFARAVWRIKYVYESHGYRSPSVYDFFRRRLIERLSSGIVSISKGLDILYSNSSKPRTIAFCGVDSKRMRTNQPIQVLREKLGMRGDVYIFGYIGSLHHFYEGIPVLLEGFAELQNKESEKPFELWIVGGKDTEIKELKEKYPAYNVRYVGQVPFAEVSEYQSAVDALVIPLRETGEPGASPVKMFEQMFSDRPIIASDALPIQEVLIDGVNAILFKVGDSSDLAKKMLKLSQNVELQETVVAGARKGAGLYTFRKRAEHIMSVIERI